ncbi:uncharacterized protein LOC121915725 [Sceloporus undulatus]|uniref:uncharacterized protein LOC121915725 n=1 Tax=Sceloporus undulatus TaxID=8520 RepID=UPI001C4B86CB|nr:uncharacterized protein LOC121915725 [Sceloporus undulatus]
MATQRVYILATLAWSLLVMPLWFGAADSLKPCYQQQPRLKPCYQQQPRRHIPPQPDTLLWQEDWVPLMILLGGFCAMAWCIHFLAYNVHQRGSQELPQLPSEEEAVPELRETQKEMSRLLFRAESNTSNLGIGNQPRMENQQEASEGLKSMMDLERKSKSSNLVDERTGSVLQLDTKATSQNLVPERSRSIIQLQTKVTSQRFVLRGLQRTSNWRRSHQQEFHS